MPNTNRMASPDTIIPNPTNPQSFNRYSYVNNNPVNYTDPTGHCVVEGVGLEGKCTPMPPPSTLPQLKSYTAEDLDYIGVTLLAENNMGTHSPQSMTMMAWVWINRSSPGEVFSDVENGGQTGCPGGQRCGAWYGIISYFLPKEISYVDATPEQREEALQDAIECYRMPGCSSFEENFQNVRAIVENVYENYQVRGADPTNGSVQYAHQSTKRYNAQGVEVFEYSSGDELYNALSTNFAEYQQEHPEFRYAISDPYFVPYPDGTKPYVLVTGTWESCVVYGSCGQ